MKAEKVAKIGGVSTVATGSVYSDLTALDATTVAHSSTLPIVSATSGYVAGTIGLPAAALATTMAALPAVVTGCAIITLGAGGLWAVRKLQTP
jgi:hypothetical protein